MIHLINNNLYAHIFATRAIKKRLEIKATDPNSLRKLVKSIKKITNIDTLSLSFATLSEFSINRKSFYKLDTQNLRIVSLYSVKVTLKDLVRMIHKCDEL